MTRFISAYLVIFVILGALLGCSVNGTKREIVVSAAASLTDVFQEIKVAFEARHNGIYITYNFASSDTLAAQIEQGAPVDVFASADEQTMDTLATKGLIVADTRHNFASNRVVLVKQKGSQSALKGFEDLTDKSMRRIAIGNPDTVPAGRYAKQVLTNLQLWDGVKEKLVFGENVRQVLSYVERGEVDAGLVYRSDAMVSTMVEIIASAPPGSHKEIVYPIAVLPRTEKAELAKSYIDFLLSSEGQAILRNYGFDNVVSP